MADVSSAERNRINLLMRQQPWYQAWFRSKGLDPNKVKLTDAQRKELSALAQQHGIPVGKDLIIDQAGNTNIHHGFQGQPGWLKALEIGGAALGTAGLAGWGPLAGMFGAGGDAGLAASVGAPAATEASIFGSAPAAGGVASLAGAGGGTLSKLIGPLANTGLGLAGAALTQRQINKATQAQTQAADKAMGVMGDIYAQQRQDQQPFLNLGTGAANLLGFGVGIPGYEKGNQAPPQASQMVQLKAPTGEIKAVPASQASFYEQKGAVRI